MDLALCRNILIQPVGWVGKPSYHQIMLGFVPQPSLPWYKNYQSKIISSAQTRYAPFFLPWS